MRMLLRSAQSISARKRGTSTCGSSSLARRVSMRPWNTGATSCRNYMEGSEWLNRRAGFHRYYLKEPEHFL